MNITRKRAISILLIGIAVLTAAGLQMGLGMVQPLGADEDIRGFVKDEWGNPITDVLVTAEHRSTGQTFSDHTNPSGMYQMKVDPLTGWFDLMVTKSGWHSKTGEVYKYSGEVAEKDFELIPYFYRNFPSHAYDAPAWTDKYHSWDGMSAVSAYYTGDRQRPSASCLGSNSYAEAKTGQYITFTYDKPSTNRGKVTAKAYGHGAYLVEEGGSQDATSSLKVYCEVYKGSEFVRRRYFTDLSTTKTSPCVNWNWNNEQTISIYYIQLVQGYTYNIYIKAWTYTRTLGGRSHASYGDNLVAGVRQYWVEWKDVTVQTVNTA